MASALNRLFQKKTLAAKADNDLQERQLDRRYSANQHTMSSGLDLARIALAYADWGLHLSMSPGRRVELGVLGLQQAADLYFFALQKTGPKQLLPTPKQDGGATDQAWQKLPFALLEKTHQAQRYWWQRATTDIAGVSPHNERLVRFFTQLGLDAFSPANYFWTNPEVLRTTWQHKGQNLLKGARNLARDMTRKHQGQPPYHLEQFKVGHNLATTPGKVVYQNQLIELIQYQPTTQKTHPEPVLIVPAWIMKYYILDLAEGRSLVRYLLDQGHTVFIISWKNPDASDRDLSMADYRQLGPMAALDAIGGILPQQPIHAMGYCVGGTLLSITAAAMARDKDQRLATLSLLAAQTDFTEPGELSLFINESQLQSIEDVMWQQGYLDKEQMASAFQLLRANELIWQPMVNHYLLGEDATGIDLMAWNADATRMPYRMHSEYLDRLYLHNKLARGQYLVDDRPVSLRDINIPIFAVGTEKDHIAPWTSVYKIGHLTNTPELTFLLTSGGHNAGIITPPDHPRRRYRLRSHPQGQYLPGPQEWYDTTPAQQGSWWPVWQDWLAAHSSAKVTAPEPAADLPEAPGQYVYQT